MIEAMKQMVEALQHIEKCEGLTQQGHKAIQTGIQAIAEAEKQEQNPNDLTIAYMSGVYDGKKNYKNSLVKQARYVRNYSNTEESFKAVPLKFILEEAECRFKAKLKEKNT